MNKITIILKESGTIAEIKKNFSIYRGSAQNILLNILVPKSIIEGKLCTQYVDARGNISTENGVYTVVKIGEIYYQNDGRIGKTSSYYLRYLKDIKTCDGEYQLYERILPSAFTKIAGTGISAPQLIINVENILNNITIQEDGEKIVNEPTVISLITSQSCRLDIEQSTNLDLDPVVEPSEFDLLEGMVNDLSQEISSKPNIKDTVLKLNLLESLPNSVIYNKDGYKTLGIHFFNEKFIVPINATEKVEKTGAVFVSDARPHETELYWVYQDEIFEFDAGTVKRTLTINAVQKDIGQYTTIKVGEWKPIGDAYYKGIESTLESQKREIDSLKGRSSRYVINMAENTNPSQDELTNAFKQASGLEEPKDGTTLLDLDNNKEYTWFENNNKWEDRGASTITSFTNTSSGSIQGSEQDGFVTAQNGKGKVSGWETIKEDIKKNADNLTKKIEKEDLLRTSIEKTIQPGENSVIEEISYKDLRDNSITTEQFELKGTDENISVNVQGNKVILKANPEGISKVHTISLNKEETLTPDEKKDINLPAFVKEDQENEIEGKAGIISKEQASKIAFKDDARNIAEEIVEEEQTRAEFAEENLSKRIDINKQSSFENKAQIQNIKNDYIPKDNASASVVTDESFAVGETGTLDQTEKVLDLKTGQATTTTKTAIPVVNGKARLFLPQEQETLQDLEHWRASMQGEALSYQTDLSGVPSGETSSPSVQAYLTAKYKSLVGKDIKPLDQTLIADESTGVAYKWYSNDNLWYLSHGSPSSLAGNNIYSEDGSLESGGNSGTLVGSNKEGYILIETNGEAALNGYDALKENVGLNTTKIDKEVKDRKTALSNETSRAQTAEENNKSAIESEVSRAKTQENSLSTAITEEISRAQAAEKLNADNITAEITRAKTAESKNSTAISTETNARSSADSALQKAIEDEVTNRESANSQLEAKIPTTTSKLTNDGDGIKVSGNTDPYAKVSQIPTNNNQLTNGAGYAKKSELDALDSKLTTGLASKADSSRLENVINNTVTIQNAKGGASVGQNSYAGLGFSGGYNASVKLVTTDEPVDAIQLGAGLNGRDHSLQVYDDNIYNANTHTLTVQNISLAGTDLASKFSAQPIGDNVTQTGQNDRVTSYYASGLTWYRTWASGWKECGLQLPDLTKNGGATVRLPISFRKILTMTATPHDWLDAPIYCSGASGSEIYCGLSGASGQNASGATLYVSGY